MNARQYKQAVARLKEQNKLYGFHLEPIPPAEWNITSDPMPDEVWRSADFLVQVFREPGGVIRLTVNRTMVLRDGRWMAGITWDELQRLKRDSGFGSRQAAEIYPPDRDLVDDANMRHLWIPPEPLPFAWTRENAA